MSTEKSRLLDAIYGNDNDNINDAPDVPWCVPYKERPGKRTHTEEPRVQPCEKVTWVDPDEEQLKQLNKNMFFKTARMLLSMLLLSAYLILTVMIRQLNLEKHYVVIFTIVAAVPVLLYYWLYRNALVFGERYVSDEEVRDGPLLRMLWIVLNYVVLAPLFLWLADKFLIVSYVLIGIMVLLSFRQELLMLILFVLRKYTIKTGDVYFHQKKRGVRYGGTDYPFWIALVYVLDFEDAAARKIPVMVDCYTYHKLKAHGDAYLINYKYGKSYMFEIVRIKDKKD